MDLGHFQPVNRSIPNMLNQSFHNNPELECALARSSSQPTELWCRDLSDSCDRNISPNGTETLSDRRKSITSHRFKEETSSETQTESYIDYATLEQLVLSNPHLVLKILGIQAVYKNESDMMPYNLSTITEVQSSRETVSSHVNLLCDERVSSDVVNFSFTKLSQIVCLINTYISMYR